MKRRFIIFTLIAVIVTGVLGCLTACSSFAVSDMESFRKSLYKNYGKGTATLQNDLTLYTNDSFFGTDAEMNEYTFDGKGHTITIKGDEGAFLSSNRHGLFQTMTDSTIKDVTIIYDFNAKFKKCSFGGLAEKLSKCTLENVHIKFTRPITFSGDNFGGLAGTASGSTFVNCSVECSMNGSGLFAGGVVGFMGSGSMTNCTYSGGMEFTVTDGQYNLNSAKDYLGAAGGLVGALGGSVSACSAEISKLYVSLNADRWSTVGCDAGGFIGFAGGTAQVSDCYVDLPADGDYYFAKSSGGLFERNLRTGLIAGEIDKGAKIKNIYADASKFTASGAKFLTNGKKVSFDFGSVLTNNIEGIYILSGSIVEQYNFTDAPVTATEGDGSTRLTAEWEETFGIDGIVLTCTKSGDKYSYQEGVFDIIANGQQTVAHGAPDSVSTDTLTSVYSNESTCEGEYYFRISVTLKGGTADISLARRHVKFANTSSSQVVMSYDDIAFNLGENVIGGSSSRNVWKRDSETGKWIF